MDLARFSSWLHSGVAIGFLLATASIPWSGSASAQQQQQQKQQPQQQQQQQQNQQQEAAAPSSGTATAEQPDRLSEDELEVLVARIALYPDELVALVSSASLFPLQIVQAERFLEKKKTNKDLTPDKDWDDSVISLLNYPEIVKMMSDDLDWTEALGSALAYQQKDVLMAIQTLRDKAVAEGMIKSDDKIKVEAEGDNVIIQSANPEVIYVPQYEPQMLYEPGYAPAPISYYDQGYPNYYYPTAPYFAAAITGAAIWAATVDWDDWGVWGGNWGGDVDIDCDKCFNNVNIDRGKFKMNEVDWRNVDRSKINFDRNQFANLDRTEFKRDFTGSRDNNLANRAKEVRRNGGDTVANRAGKVSVEDVRKSKVEADRVRQQAGNSAARAGQGAAARREGGAAVNRPGGASGAGKVANNRPANVDRKVSKPKPGSQVQRSGNRPSAIGNVSSKRQTQVASNRGRQSMSGASRSRPSVSSGGRRGGGGGARPRGGGGGRGGGGRR
ncbi:DUF3300 domain-containing protein [Mycoplana dimorpha]|uniref:Uncharacterized protein DUF3300 n=1 Tax=Mycoplana dimorpha TaxID=28320 RepID=A0A2T5B3F5_MYCDI|nr:DUF3300 domain-containing protein [Mycoplana dimorpha]PTM93500.1 uncharacterized protein DUF3300 [Mycoplana dimorpha]